MRRALELRPLHAAWHRDLGAALEGWGRLAEAEAPLRRALELDPLDVSAHEALAHLLSCLDRVEESVMAAIHARHVEQAVDEADALAALEHNPNDAEGHTSLGYVLDERGRRDEAEAAWRRALEEHFGVRLPVAGGRPAEGA